MIRAIPFGVKRNNFPCLPEVARARRAVSNFRQRNMLKHQKRTTGKFLLGGMGGWDGTGRREVPFSFSRSPIILYVCSSSRPKRPPLFRFVIPSCSGVSQRTLHNIHMCFYPRNGRGTKPTNSSHPHFPSKLLICQFLLRL